MYNTIVFDLDGTLLDTLDDLRNSVNYAMKLHGFQERTREDVRKFVGNGVEKLVERSVGKNISADLFDEIFADFKCHYQKHCNDLTKPYSGIIEVLRELKRRRYKLGIASNKSKSDVQKLNDIHFNNLFDGVAGAVAGKPVKPDPYMIDTLLSELNSEKLKTLYVGDSQVDLQTASNANLDIISVLWGFREKKELIAAGAKKIIESPFDLFEFIK